MLTNILNETIIMPLPRYILPKTLAAKKVTLLGCPMHALTMEETIKAVDDAISTRHAMQHVVVNVAKLVHLQNDQALYADVCGSDVISVDGMGVVWGAKAVGVHIPERVAGIDIMEHVLALCAQKGFRPYILGAKRDILDKAMAHISAAHPRLEFAGSHDGYYDRNREAELMQDIHNAKPDCLFIAMPSPHKERVMGNYRDMLEIPFIMGVGGSVDVYAGYVSRAPEWMQRCGMEWLYRLLQEPKRMFKRYATTNAAFAWLLLKAKIGLYHKADFMKA